MTVEAYPLCWPHGRPRTERPRPSQFNTTFGVARDALLEEIRRLGGRHPIISTNVPLRQDGIPYASRKPPQDTGVAVYFTYHGHQHCFACDKWTTVADSIQATRKTIEALRGIARWGTGDMMERAFTGFAQLPDPAAAGNLAWWHTLQVDHNATPEEVKAAYQRRRKETHPDHGGDPTAFAAVQSAWEQYRRGQG